MNFFIRKAEHRDAEGIIHVHVTSIRTICGKDYTADQIEAWAGRKSRPELWWRAIDRDFIWVIEGEGQIFGFGHLAVMNDYDGEVMGLYFIPPAVGKGLAKRMFEKFMEVAREHNLKRLNLFSTITAKSFYETIGFRQNAGDTTVEMQGVAIPCHPMEMELFSR